MPRIRLETPDFERSTDTARGSSPAKRSPGGGDDAFARIDTDVFEALSGTRGLEQCGLRPQIDRWLECWSDG